jgi:hypothetical protein
MNFYVNPQLVLATAGTLFSLFLMILIVGYRRRRIFERVLFFLALALFFYYSGILLGLNASQFYSSGIPGSAARITELLISIGIVPVLALLVHAHFAYGRAQLGIPWRWWHKTIIFVAYISAVGFGALILQREIFTDRESHFPLPIGMYPIPNLIWLIATLVLCIVLQVVFARRADVSVQRRFHNFLAVYFGGVGLFATWVLLVQSTVVDGWFGSPRLLVGSLDYWTSMGLVFAWVLPLVLIVYAIVRHQALGIGSQKNLVYSFSIAFLAVLYLSLVRRVSGWLEPNFPPDATAGLLLFLLLAFFEPLQRLASRLLRRGFREQVDRLQRLSAELQREALRGEPGKLIEFA